MNVNASPVDPRSPSREITPSSKLTGPDKGVRNPLIGIVVGLLLLTTDNPSNTVKFLSVKFIFLKTTTMVHPADRFDTPFQQIISAIVYLAFIPEV